MTIPDEIMKSAVAYERLNKQKETLEASLDVLRSDILSFTGATESFSSQQSGLIITTTVTADSTMLDSKKVKADYPEVFNACSKPKKGSTKLTVKKVKPAVPAEVKKAA